jgi:hypothetical protein
MWSICPAFAAPHHILNYLFGADAKVWMFSAIRQKNKRPNGKLIKTIVITLNRHGNKTPRMFDHTGVFLGSGN